MKVITETCRGH